MNNSTRQAVTAALMAGFFLVANGLALAWTLTTDGPYMRQGLVIVLIGISASLFPVLMWGQFRLPRLVQIALEITETVLVEDTAAAAETLHALQDIGVKLVLDDFGTGYSSLGYVKRFPLSFLKIDRSFVADLGHNGRDMAIVSAIAEMARALGARVVAEGVETEEQLRGVRKLGCELAQGYLFARPLPPDEIDGLLRTDPWRVVTISR